MLEPKPEEGTRPMADFARFNHCGMVKREAIVIPLNEV